MRTLIVGALAALAVASAPSIASAQTGYVGVNYGHVDSDGGDGNAWGADAAIAFQGSGSIGFEVDAAYVDPEDADSTVGATGHIYTRNDTHLLGAFVGVANNNDSTIWDAGVEGNLYYNNWTLAGDVVYANDDDADTNAWGADVAARYFVTDNARVDVKAGWARVNPNVGDDDNVWNLGVGGEYQFSSVPVSLGLSYNHAEFDNADFSSDAVAVEARWNFGGGSLKDRDRHGASQADLTGIASVL